MSLIVLCGKTASGKTLIRSMLKTKGYEPIVTYTTRPKRSGEIDGKSYHFISDEEFDRMIDDGEFAEYKSYNVANGDTWRYGSTKESLNKRRDAVIILTPDGYRDIKDKLPVDHKCIYLYSNRSTIKTRLKFRGDSPDEIERRMKADNIDFKDFQYENGVKVVYNNLGDDITNVLDKIMQ